jgi:hypothetical protein
MFEPEMAWFDPKATMPRVDAVRRCRVPPAGALIRR